MRDTKERIQSEALRLFAENGYHAVTVEQIAAAVGIKAPSLYKHYSGKRAIFDGIVHQMEARDLQQARRYQMPEENGTAENPAGETATMERVCAFSRAQFRDWTEDEFLSRFRRMLTLEQYRDPEMARLYGQYLSAGPVALSDGYFPASGGFAGGGTPAGTGILRPHVSIIQCIRWRREKRGGAAGSAFRPLHGKDERKTRIG